MANEAIPVLAAAAVVLAVLGGSHGKAQNGAYEQGFKTGVLMRQQGGQGLTSGSRSLIMYCRQAPYTAYIPSKNAGQWLAGYDRGCDGK
jgi:hypothetical protein